MVSQEIGHSSVVMTEKYAKFNLRKLRDDFPSLKDRINLRLTTPNEDKYFTTLLNVIQRQKMALGYEFGGTNKYLKS